MKLFCRHNKKFIRILYGDAITYFKNKRQIWICEKCKKLFYK